MEDVMVLRRRAEEHRAAARTTQDLWESVVRFNLAARYDELAARKERKSPESSIGRPEAVRRIG